MTKSTKIALAAALFSAIASPSFALSQDEASVTENSGRITATYISMPHAYASAARDHWMHVTGTRDFQLQGRGVGRASNPGLPDPRSVQRAAAGRKTGRASFGNTAASQPWNPCGSQSVIRTVAEPERLP
jgi:hypothetical protein